MLTISFIILCALWCYSKGLNYWPLKTKFNVLTTLCESNRFTEGRGFESHLGLGFFWVSSGFICNILNLMLIIVSHSLTLVVGWPHRSHKIQATIFQWCFNVTARCSYELCCQWLFDSVAEWCSLSQIPTFKYPNSPLLTIESPVDLQMKE